MNVARAALNNSKLILLAVVLLTMAGLLSAFQLPSNIYPEVQFPRITIVASSDHLSPRNMTLAVTRPLEEASRTVLGVRRVRSKTIRGSTEINVLFQPDIDMQYALQLTQARLAETKESLPPETSMVVERLTPSLFPILSINVLGDLPPADLRDVALYQIRPRLSRVAAVSRVEVQGSDVREVSVIVDPSRLQAAHLGLEDVKQALARTNVITSVGRLPMDYKQYLVLASGERKTLEDIGKTVVTFKNQTPVKVGDLATVEYGVADPTILIYANGRPGAFVNVSRQIGGNISQVAQDVKDAMREMRASLPSAVKLSVVYDLAEFVKSSIANVRDAIFIGGVLAVIVLILFLRNWRITLIAATTLPLTIVGTFFVMRIFGTTINLMSMGGMAVAIGLVIDDAIVVVENIHRHIESGMGVLASVEQATNELVAPVVGSTLTTVVVFLPLGLLEGVVGQFFAALSITLVTAVLISLMLALLFIPVLAASVLREKSEQGRDREEAPRERTGPERQSRMESFCGAVVNTALKVRWLVIAGVLLLCLVGVFFYLRMETGFLPEMDEGGFVVDYWTPPGTSLPETNRMVHQIETVLAEMPEQEAFARRTGAEMGLFATQQNRGDIVVKLKPKRSRSANEIIADERDKMAVAVPGVIIEFVQILSDLLGDLEGNPEPVEVKIFGDDLDQLASLAAKVEEKLHHIDGVVDIKGVLRGNPEMVLQIDPVRAARAGLTAAEISDQLDAGLLGVESTQVRQIDRLIPIRVRLPDQYRFNFDWVRNFPLKNSGGETTLLSSVADVHLEEGQAELFREDLKPMVAVTGRLENRDLGSAIRDVRKTMQDIVLPLGYRYEIGGQYESQQRAFRDLITVLAISALLVFGVMVAQFKRFIPALVIMSAAPLAMVGALGLLWITDIPLNVSSFMGLILLIGLVVKNGIILIDYSDRLSAQPGADFDRALVQAAQIRLRPILMTTLCTLFGLFPLALGLGSGAELQKPLAVAVIGGLTLSTIITLVFVPTLYSLLSRKTAAG
ncbi:MAG TPA: efflux RND transporter permease subunit [Acidobacteriota bacterium]|nr:efflux RND transporter permease subunit [Acidobacteriota bacterium]